MKVTLLLISLILLSSCGKKSGGPKSGDSPLLPAPATTTVTATEDTVESAEIEEKMPMPDLQPQGLRIEYPFVICFNTLAKNYDKKLALQDLLELIHQNKVALDHPVDEYISLLNDAIRTLEKSDEETHLCPKIYLAINKKN